jgi:imidazolonepropionase-like amidohydrolase
MTQALRWFRGQTTSVSLDMNCHHEMELYAQAGIPASNVLRMATLVPAQVMGGDKDLGIIAAGKLADIILIDGDPTVQIKDIENVVLTVKGGDIYEPNRIEASLGIAPPPLRH